MGHTTSLFLFVLALVMPGERADAWVAGHQPFPDGEATVVLHRFCFLADCGSASQGAWQAVIHDALDEWNNAGASFRFSTRPVRSTDDPCNMPNAVAVILTEPGRLCPGDGPMPGGEVSGRTEYGPGRRARVYINDADDFFGLSTQITLLVVNPIFQYLVHEFGHVVGLSHPDQAGQRVAAIMNSDFGLTDIETLLPDDIAGVRALYPPAAARLAGTLESPAHGATVSGLGFISGWKCGSRDITVQIDDRPPTVVAMGMPRGDTRSTCGGEVENGFITQMNWNWLSDGTHTAVAYDNGIEFARSTFTVMTTGEEFLSGIEAQCTIPDFPVSGQEAIFRWNEATQHLELAAVSGTENEPEQPPTPSPSQGAIYWVADSAIQRTNLDGSQQETVLSLPFWPTHLHVDPIENKFYWMNDPGDNDELIIQRANLDGSQQENLVYPDRRYPHREQVAYNFVMYPIGRKMYWTVTTSATTGATAIERANLDGSEVETIISSPYWLSQVSVDAIGEKLYWTDLVDPRSPRDSRRYAIHQANLNGSQEETLFIHPPDPRGPQNLVADFIGRKLYWTERHQGILRANLDGSNRERLVDTGAHWPHTLAVDFSEGRLYWTDTRRSLMRANLDGSQQELLIEGIMDFTLGVPE